MFQIQVATDHPIFFFLRCTDPEAKIEIKSLLVINNIQTEIDTYIGRYANTRARVRATAHIQK